MFLKILFERLFTSLQGIILQSLK